jgi:acetolactate synthase-1/2/3 large subunit
MAYLDAIREAMPRESLLVVDNTQLGYWADYFYASYRPGGYMAAKGSSIIGFSFAAAAGAKIACPDLPIAALIGDGGFLYSEQELATCQRHGIGFPVIVVNDNAYGVIGSLQRMAYNATHENELMNPDFLRLAEAYGVKGTYATSPEELGTALTEALAGEEMRVIELPLHIPEPPFFRY